MKKIYSYRLLTNSNGIAPCVQNGVYTLACCKCDMRRVIGSQLEENSDNVIYVVAFAGNNNDMGIEKNDCVYISKIEEAILYEKYFAKSTKYKKRRDNIYEYIKKPDENLKEENKEMYWKYIAKNHFHEEFQFQARDFDIKRDKSQCYVLKSSKYRFFSYEAERKAITETLMPVFCKGQGHRVFPNENMNSVLCSEICGMLDEYLEKRKDPGYIKSDARCSRRSSCQR